MKKKLVWSAVLIVGVFAVLALMRTDVESEKLIIVDSGALEDRAAALNRIVGADLSDQELESHLIDIIEKLDFGVDTSRYSINSPVLGLVLRDLGPVASSKSIPSLVTIINRNREFHIRLSAVELLDKLDFQELSTIATEVLTRELDGRGSRAPTGALLPLVDIVLNTSTVEALERLMRQEVAKSEYGDDWVSHEESGLDVEIASRLLLEYIERAQPELSFYSDFQPLSSSALVEIILTEAISLLPEGQRGHFVYEIWLQYEMASGRLSASDYVTDWMKEHPREMKSQVPKLVKMADSESSLQALGIILHIDPKAAEPILARIVRKRSPISHRYVGHLLSIGGSEYVDLVRALLGAGEEENRLAAIRYLPMAIGENAVGDLALALEKDKSESIRLASAQELAKLGPSNLNDLLIGRLTDWYVAPFAAKTLAQDGWEPKSQFDDVHFRLALARNSKADSIRLGDLEEVREVLLKDLNSKDKQSATFSIYQSIYCRNEEMLAELALYLHSQESVDIANVFLLAGHPQLTEEAKKWASKRGISYVAADRYFVRW